MDSERRAQIAREICATPLQREDKRSIWRKKDQELLADYAASPVTAQYKYNQAARKWQNVLALTTPMKTGGILLAAATFLLIFGFFFGIQHAKTVSGLWVLPVVGGMLLSIVGMHLEEILPRDMRVIDFLEEHSGAYLPSIQYERTPSGLQISLADEEKVYTSAVFSVRNADGALEYQVELEEIIESVREERSLQFAQLHSVEAEPVAELEAGEVHEQLQLSNTMLVDNKRQLAELEALLRQQRAPSSLAI